MPTTLTGGKRRLALLAVVAVLTSLVGFAAPASALVTDACPSTIPGSGFTDLTGVPADAVDAIDCIKSYGISAGTTPNTFSPFTAVERWQMALFLQKTAQDMQIPLDAAATSPFGDLTGLSTEAQTAINQIYAAGIAGGTSSSTFAPFAKVERWQMALFLTALLDEVPGVTLPDGSSQGFTDLAGVPAAAVTAINQIKQLGVARGTTDTTFDPFGVVERWQMALFLAASLDEAGVTPAEGQVTVNPSTAGTISQSSARAYTATFRNLDGSLYTGQVGIHLVSLEADGTPEYNGAAPTAVIEQVDGAAEGDNEFNGFPGLDGSVTFIVRAGASNEDVVPVVWMDLNADSDYESTGDVQPGEPFALGGAIEIVSPPAEAVDGTHTGAVVQSVNATGNSFVGDDVAHAPETFNYDSNDIFLIAGNLVTEAQFEAALSETDVVDVASYATDDSVVVTFNIVTDNTATAGLKVTAPASATQVDSASFTIRGTGEPGQIITIYVDGNDDGNKDPGEPAVASGTVAADGTWSVNVPLTQIAVNNFTATMASTVGGAANDSGVDVPAITEGPQLAARLAPSTWTDATPNGLDPGDVLTLNFTEAVDAPDNGDTVELTDSDGTRVRITCGAEATCAATDSDTITVTVNLFVEILTPGGTAGLQSPAQIQALGGFVGDDGLAVDVVGSGANRLITEA